MKIVYCQSALTARVWKLRRCRIMTTIWEINWSSCTRKSMSLQRTWKNLLKKLKNWKQSFIRWRSVIRQQEILQKLEVQPIQAIVSFSKIPRKKLTEFKKGNPRNLEWTRKNWGRSLIFFWKLNQKRKKSRIEQRKANEGPTTVKIDLENDFHRKSRVKTVHKLKKYHESSTPIFNSHELSIEGKN